MKTMHGPFSISGSFLFREFIESLAGPHGWGREQSQYYIMAKKEDKLTRMEPRTFLSKVAPLCDTNQGLEPVDADLVR